MRLIALNVGNSRVTAALMDGHTATQRIAVAAREPAALTVAHVSRRSGFGPAEPARDVHDRPLAERPVEQPGVERTLGFEVTSEDLEVHDRPDPVRPGRMEVANNKSHAPVVCTAGRVAGKGDTR